CGKPTGWLGIPAARSAKHVLWHRLAEERVAPGPDRAFGRDGSGTEHRAEPQAPRNGKSKDQTGDEFRLRRTAVRRAIVIRFDYDTSAFSPAYVERLVRTGQSTKRPICNRQKSVNSGHPGLLRDATSSSRTTCIRFGSCCRVGSTAVLKSCSGVTSSNSITCKLFSFKIVTNIRLYGSSDAPSRLGDVSLAHGGYAW